MSSDRVVRSLLAGTKDNPSHAAKFTIIPDAMREQARVEYDEVWNKAGEGENRTIPYVPACHGTDSMYIGTINVLISPVFLRGLSFLFLCCHFSSYDSSRFPPTEKARRREESCWRLRRTTPHYGSDGYHRPPRPHLHCSVCVSERSSACVEIMNQNVLLYRIISVPVSAALS